MVRFILLLLLAFFLANWIATSLTFAFGTIFNLDAVNVLALLPNLTERSEPELIELGFWTLVIWILFSFVHVPFGFIRPRVGRYSDTKPLRYFQSIFFEIFMLLPSAIIIGWGVGVVLNFTQSSTEISAEDRQTIHQKISWEYAKGVSDEMIRIGSVSDVVYITNNYSNWRNRLGLFLAEIPSECNKFLEDYANDPSDFGKKPNEEIDFSNLYLNFTGETLSKGKCYFYNETHRLAPIITREVNQAATALLQEQRNNLFNAAPTTEKFINDRPWVFAGIILVGHWFIRGAVQVFITSWMCMKIISLLDASKRGYGGAGRFTGLFEEMANSFYQRDDEIFLGRSLFNPFVKIGLRDDRHMLTIGGSRGGKGVSAIIPNLLKWKGSALVIDPKGTNAAVTARFRREKLGQTVHVVDPFGESKLDDVAYFDPLAQFSAADRDAREKVMLVADALVVQAEGTRDPHWDEKSVTIIAGYIAHLMTHPTYENRRTLPELRKMVNLSGNERLQLFTDMQGNMSFGRLPHEVANSIENMENSTEFKNIISSMEKHTEWMSSPAMIEAMWQASFKFSDLKNERTTIYLVIPPQYLETHARFMRLFINLAIKGFADGGRSRIPTLMIMDEFLSLERMAIVENAMSWAAGYNLFLWPFVQQYGTFKKLYGESVDAFISNCRAVQVFAVNGQPTKEFVSENLGKRPLQSLLNVTRSNETLPLREASEVDKDVSAESGRQYIIQTGKPTMLIERVPYFKSLFFSGYDPDPDHPKPLSWWQKQW